MLYSRSEYFRALFASDMKESSDGVIVIQEFSYEAVYEMIRFLYSGRCSINAVRKRFKSYIYDNIMHLLLQHSALQILEIGLKYHLPDLVHLTEAFIERAFSFDTVFPILVEADRLDAQSIRQRALNFILNHWAVLARYVALSPSSSSHSPQTLAISVSLYLGLVRCNLFHLRCYWNSSVSPLL
jgi:hypothetical protein